MEYQITIKLIDNAKRQCYGRVYVITAMHIYLLKEL